MLIIVLALQVIPANQAAVIDSPYGASLAAVLRAAPAAQIQTLNPQGTPDDKGAHYSFLNSMGDEVLAIDMPIGFSKFTISADGTMIMASRVAPPHLPEQENSRSQVFIASTKGVIYQNTEGLVGVARWLGNNVAVVRRGAAMSMIRWKGNSAWNVEPTTGPHALDLVKDAPDSGWAIEEDGDNKQRHRLAHIDVNGALDLRLDQPSEIPLMLYAGANSPYLFFRDVWSTLIMTDTGRKTSKVVTKDMYSNPIWMPKSQSVVFVEFGTIARSIVNYSPTTGQRKAVPTSGVILYSFGSLNDTELLALGRPLDRANDMTRMWIYAVNPATGKWRQIGPKDGCVDIAPVISDLR